MADASGNVARVVVSHRLYSEDKQDMLTNTDSRPILTEAAGWCRCMFC